MGSGFCDPIFHQISEGSFFSSTVDLLLYSHVTQTAGESISCLQIILTACNVFRTRHCLNAPDDHYDHSGNKSTASRHPFVKPFEAGGAEPEAQKLQADAEH